MKTYLGTVKFLKPNLFYSFRSSWDYIRVKLTPELDPIRKVNKRKNHSTREENSRDSMHGPFVLLGVSANQVLFFT